LTIEVGPAQGQALPVREAQVSRETWLRLARRARLLSWLSLVLMSAEAAVAITAGVVASSIALIGFGIDSLIEGSRA
jgi:hypothetical protein